MILDRLAAWRDRRSCWGRGCGCLLLAGGALLFVAQVLGGMMGDYMGGHSPAELAAHERAMAAWFRHAFGGLAVCVALAFWWSAAERCR